MARPCRPSIHATGRFDDRPPSRGASPAAGGGRDAGPDLGDHRQRRRHAARDVRRPGVHARCSPPAGDGCRARDRSSRARNGEIVIVADGTGDRPLASGQVRSARPRRRLSGQRSLLRARPRRRPLLVRRSRQRHRAGVQPVPDGALRHPGRAVADARGATAPSGWRRARACTRIATGRGSPSRMPMACRPAAPTTCSRRAAAISGRARRPASAAMRPMPIAIRPRRSWTKPPTCGRRRRAARRGMIFGGRDRWNYTLPDRLFYAWRVDGQAWSPLQTERRRLAGGPRCRLAHVRGAGRRSQLERRPDTGPLRVRRAPALVSRDRLPHRRHAGAAGAGHRRSGSWRRATCGSSGWSRSARRPWPIRTSSSAASSTTASAWRRSGPGSRRSSISRRSSRPSAGSPAASPTTSTTC